MPLERLHVTGPSRIMLPAYVAHATFYGLLYLINPQGRLDRAPGLAGARALLPIPAWGAFFLALAAIMVVARYAEAPRWLMLALLTYAVAMVVWAGVYALAPLLSNDASLGGPAWPLLVAAACVASYRSILHEGR